MGTHQHGTPTGLVFLSGGSATNGLASLLAASGLHATHLISVFDSGGSSGLLRDICGGIAIGDIRKRLIAIGDTTTEPSRSLVALLRARLPAAESAHDLRDMVDALARGASELLEAVPPSTAAEISAAVEALLSSVPATFDWRDCSVGNLVLAGKYALLKDWAAALAWGHTVVAARGSVLPVATAGAHLGARLVNGRYVFGQKELTNEAPPIESPIEALQLHASEISPLETVSVNVHEQALQALQAARVIVYSWGSFYTSVLCSLLVDGLGDAVKASRAPKVLLLNPFHDAETAGKQPADLVRELQRYAAARNGHVSGPAVTHVVALRTPRMSAAGLYDPRSRRQIEALGVEVIEVKCDGVPQAKELQHIMERLLGLGGTHHGGQSRFNVAKRTSTPPVVR